MYNSRWYSCAAEDAWRQAAKRVAFRPTLKVLESRQF
jgi:hypothetical protein